MGIEYASLHNHSHASILDGFAQVHEYLDRAQEIGLKGIGLTDHGSTTKIYEFLKKAEERGLPAVPGCEMYAAPINPLGSKVKEPVFYGPNGKRARNDVSGRGAYLHLTIWAYNQEGLHNLYKLSSISWEKENYYMKPRIDFETLEEHSSGIIVGAGCPSSEISTRFLLGQDEKAYEYANRLLEVFGRDRLYIEIMDHDMSVDIERRLLPKQLKLAKDLKVGLLATNDSHYAFKENAHHHEEMLCSQSGAIMSDEISDKGGKRFAFDGSEFYLKSAEETIAKFPEEAFPDAIKNSLKILEMADDLKVKFDPHLRPKPKVPSDLTEVDYFKKLINQGYKEKYGKSNPEVKKDAKERIAKEFDVIHSSDFVGYFLTVYEYLKWARDNYSTYDDDGTEILASSLGCGRGSVGGSIIAYLLNISELCPIKHDLVFERFLSAGRGATYLITYEDGTQEEIIVSENKKILENGEEKKRFIHELEVGDIVIEKD